MQSSDADGRWGRGWFLIADAQGSHEGGLVRKVQDREASRASGNCEHQQGGNTSAVGRCVRSLRCYVIEII